jgi:hypothetical protein
MLPHGTALQPGEVGQLLYGARFRQKFTPEDAIGSHAFAPLEALAGM